MTTIHRLCPRFVAAAALVLCAGLFAMPARADDTIKRPGDHPDYNFEIEPHLVTGSDDYGFGVGGYGLGLRAGIPIVNNGFITTINNSVAISFGIDWLHYDWCFFVGGVGCSADFFEVPVVLQWNFYVAQHWSVYAEPGLYIWHGFFNDQCPGLPAGFVCRAPSATGVDPAIYIGGRYHFSDKVALNLRLGFPSLSLGVSFFP